MNPNSRLTGFGVTIAAILCAVLAGGANPKSATGQEPAFWVRDLPQAQRIAAERHCLLLIHFWNYNCGPCVAMDRKVFSEPNVLQSISVNYVGVRVNVTELPDLKRQFNIDRWPVDVIVTPEGEEVYRAVSEQDPQRYVAQLDRVAAHRRVGMKTPRDPVDRQQPYATDTSASAGNRGTFGGRETEEAGYAPGGAAWATEMATRAQAESLAPNQRPQDGGPWQPRVGNNYDTASSHNPGYQGASEPYRGRTDLYRPREDALRNNPGAWGPDRHQSETRPVAGIAPPAGAMPSTNLADGNRAFVQQPTTPPGSAAQQPDPRSSRAADWDQLPSAGGVRGAAPPTPASNPPLGLDGFCPVALAEEKEWREGDPRFGVVHRGRTYLFANEQAKQLFMQAPDRFSPMLSGYDPVKFIEERQLVEGRRKHGLWLGHEMYLFADEESLQRFWNNRKSYSGIVIQAMRGDAGGRIQR